MNKIWLVTKHDAGVILRQPGFWLMAVLMPVVLVGIQALLMARGYETAETVQSAGEGTRYEMPAIGLLDPAGLQG